jgi:hypothetical protein
MALESFPGRFWTTGRSPRWPKGRIPIRFSNCIMPRDLRRPVAFGRPRGRLRSYSGPGSRAQRLKKRELPWENLRPRRCWPSSERSGGAVWVPLPGSMRSAWGRLPDRWSPQRSSSRRMRSSRASTTRKRSVASGVRPSMESSGKRPPRWDSGNGPGRTRSRAGTRPSSGGCA